MMVKLVPLVLRVLLAVMGTPALLGILVMRVPLVPLVLQDTTEIRVFLETRELKDLQVLLVPKVLKENMALQVQQVITE
jgi:hypothetical protein